MAKNISPTPYNVQDNVLINKNIVKFAWEESRVHYGKF
jgi:hypothetical protein